VIKLVHYLYVLSSWSFVAEDAVLEARQTFGEALEYDWRIAVTDYGGEGPFAKEQLQFYYDRLEVATGRHMNLEWWRPGYDWLVPDRVVAAARLLGCDNSDVRLALAKAGLQDGIEITDLSNAAEIASAASGISRSSLLKMANDAPTAICLFDWRREFLASGVSLRPAFQITNDLGDRVVLSGIWNAGPLISAIDALLTDERSYYDFVSDRAARTT
jgi:predicted DsbA family dithiol-disulfide isomerase